MSDKLGLPWLKGTPLVSTITSVCASAFLLFGYDQGVMSGVVISSYWLHAMGNPSTIMVSTITALYDVGAVFGALLAAFTAEGFGRKRALILGTILLIIGSILMGSCYERIQMMFGRIFTGLGIGYITAVAPVYQSEICLASQRGWHVSCQLTALLFGLLLAYWLNYGLYFVHSNLQWRFPLLFQCIFGVYIIAVTIWLPETPRWLMLHEATSHRGEIVLSKLRNKPTHHPDIIEEKNGILGAIELEHADDDGWLALFKDGGNSTNKRFYLSLGIMFMQETGGINMISYYAPTIFKESLGMSEERALFVGGFLQVWYLFASFLTWYIIDRVGRRRLFIIMATAMSIIMACEAACVAVGGTSASIAAIFLVFAFEGCFTWGWMASTWVYPAEILPLKVRAKGASLAAASCFLGNFLVVEITPPALENIGYKTYIIFAVLNLIQAVISWALYPETALLPLEQIDKLFLSNEVEKTPKKGIYTFQYSIVKTADDIFHENWRQRKMGKNVELGLKDDSDATSSDKGEKSAVQHVEVK